MARITTATFGFLGLNVLRLVSLVVLVLALVTLIMGFVEDIQSFKDDELMDEAREEDCAYVPGTWIPMQTWGIFWVELHRFLLAIAVISLFVAEVSFLQIRWLAVVSQEWMPCLSNLKGLAALGLVQIVVATSLLSHYLDEFPLVVGWMMFVVGIMYLTIGILFHKCMLKGLRSLRSEQRQQAAQFVYKQRQSPCDEKGEQASTTITSAIQGCFSRSKTQKHSINDTFPSLEMPSHKELLQEGLRRESHRRQRSSVIITIDGKQQSLFDTPILKHRAAEAAPSTHQRNATQRNSTASCQSSEYGGSVASSTVRIGGYNSARAALARAKAQERRTAAKEDNKTCINSASDRKRSRRSAVCFNKMRSRWSATAQFGPDRRRTSKQGLSSRTDSALTEVLDDQLSAPLPAYVPSG